MIKPYNPDNSPSNLGRVDSLKLAAGRKELGVRNLDDYSLNQVVEAGGRRLRGNTLAAGFAIGALALSGLAYGHKHNSNGPTHAQHQEAINSEVYLGSPLPADAGQALNTSESPNGQTLTIPDQQK
jgi:hypothetical protein